MLHMLATLLTMLLLIGTGGVIVAALDEKRGAIASALRLDGLSAQVSVAPRRLRVRWSGVRSRMAGTPAYERIAA